MKNHKYKVIKAGFWYTIANFLTKGAVFLSTPFFTRIMTKEDIGSFANFASWLDILLPIATFDLSTSLALARFDYEDELNKYISSTLMYGTIITSIIYIIVFCNLNFFCDFFVLKPYMIHTLFIYLLVCPAIQMFQTENMFKYKYTLSTVISFSSIVLSLIISLLLTFFCENKLFGRVIGYYGILIGFNIVIYLHLFQRGKDISKKYFNYAMAIAFPMIWHTLSLKLLAAGDRIVITQKIGEDANAMYSIAYMCSQVVSVLYGAMNNAWSPWATEKMNENEIDKMKKASKVYILIYSFFVFAMIIICPELLLIIGGKDYIEARFVLPPVMVACTIQFIYSLYINAEFFLKKQIRIAIGTCMASIVNIVLNLIFVPKFGYVAAAYTTLVGYFCLFIFHYISLILLGRKNWYDNKFNWFIIVAFILFIPIANILYINTNLRYFIVGVFFLVTILILYFRKKDLISAIKKLNTIGGKNNVKK